MTTAVSTLLGRPVWYELMTTDMKAAETFYKTVVGWTSAPFEGSPQPYTVFNRSGDVQVAGLMNAARRHEHAAVLGDVRRRAEARRGGGAHQAARRQRTLAGHRRADGRPHADDEGPAGRRLLHHPAGADARNVRRRRRKSARPRGTS